MSVALVRETSPRRATLLQLAGPVLAGYLTDPTTLEVLCNDNGTCFVKYRGVGKREAAHPGFGTLDTFLAGVADAVGKEWREASPSLEAAMDDLGWRIQAGRPPLTAAPDMACRLHPATIFTLEDYERQGIMTPAQRQVLAQAMRARQRLIIGGATGSAKTNVANACLDVLRDDDLRVLVIEDAPELHCRVRDTTHRWTVPGVRSLQELVARETLRLAPDFVVIGEVRGGEALYLLRAFQTGHGGLTTLHVDHVEHTLTRLEQLVGEVSVNPQRELIGEVIDLTVHMERYGTSWRCTGILEVEGWDGHQYVTKRIA